MLRNIFVPPPTSQLLAIVFTGSGFLVENAVFLFNEIELSKINAKIVFFVAFCIELAKLVFLGLHAL